MSGLLQRASEYRANQRKLRLVHAESTNGFEELGGTPDERIAIIEEIDREIGANRTEIGPDTFKVTAKKSGTGLPLLVNLIALLVVAASAFYLIRTFADREDSVVTRATALTSAEGRLLQELRAESDAQLSAKNDEIEGIRGRLVQISAEREELQSSINSQLAAQQETLRADFEAQLAAERERLQAGGLSEAEIERQLADFRTLQQADFDSRLSDIRAVAERELQQREAALNAQISDAEQSLADAESERSILQQDLRDQEYRLTTEFAAREAELTDERVAAENLLAQLRSQQEQEQLVLSQIVSLYADVQEALEAGDFDGALAGTASLRTYLSEGPAAELPTVQRRRRVELFLVESLQMRIADEQSASSPDTGLLADSAAIISNVTELVSAGESAYEATEFADARTLYLAALAEIPAVQLGYGRLTELDEQARRAESNRVSALLQRGNSLYRAGDFQNAAAAYGNALASLPSADTGLLSRVLDAGYQLRRTGDLAALRAVEAELAESAATIADLRANVASLRTEIAALRAEPQTDPRQAERISELEVELARRVDSMAALQERMDGLEVDLSGRDETVLGQQQQIASLETSVAELNTQLREARSQSQALTQQLAPYAVYSEFYESREELADEIARYRERFAANQLEGQADVPATAGPLELLEAKLLIVRILGTPEIKSRYPDLIDQLDAYLAALIAEQRADAAAETLAEVNEVLEFLGDDTATSRADRPAEVVQGLADTGDEARNFFLLLERLARPSEEVPR